MLLYAAIAFVIIVVSFTITKRANPSKISDAVARLGAWVLFFLSVFGLLTYALPELWVRAPGMAQAGWGGAITQTGSQVRQIRDDVSLILNRPASGTVGPESGIVVTIPPPAPLLMPESEFEAIQPSPVPQAVTEFYVVKRGDTLTEIAQQHSLSLADLIALNQGIDPDLLHEGDQLIIKVAQAAPEPPAPEPSPLPATDTPEPAALVQPPDFAPLAAAKGLADRAAGLEIVAEILDRFPDNETALAEQQLIRDAETKIAQWAVIGEQLEDGTYIMAAEDHQQVTALLRGLSYKVQSIESVFLSKDKWQESATLVVTSPGWLYGETITLAAGHLAQWGINEVGAEFSLNY